MSACLLGFLQGDRVPLLQGNAVDDDEVVEVLVGRGGSNGHPGRLRTTPPARAPARDITERDRERGTEGWGGWRDGGKA